MNAAYFLDKAKAEAGSQQVTETTALRAIELAQQFQDNYRELLSRAILNAKPQPEQA